VQALPHRPQFIESFIRSTQRPAHTLEAAQHVLAAQVSPVPHARPQAPQ
jgi:hypothetical protein